MYTIRFFALSGPPKCLRTESFPTELLAMAAVQAHAVGFTALKRVSDDDGYEDRITGTTPGGRAGRNIASISNDSDDEFAG